MLFPYHTSGQAWFVKGINWPWIAAYGHDIGRNQTVVWGRDRDPPYFAPVFLESEFQRMHQWNVHVVRIWTFEKAEGLTWVEDPSGNRICIRGLDETFRQNVSHIINAAHRHNIRIYWCLLNGNDFLGDSRPSKDALMRIYSSNQCKRSYIENALLPFVQFLLDNDQGTTFAIDLVNEPDALSRSTRWRGWGRSPDRVISWLAEMASEIKGYLERSSQELTRILVSTGFCEHETITDYHGRLDDLFDFFDFHAYNTLSVSDTSGDLPPYSSLGINKPCIIGECGLGGQFIRRIPIIRHFSYTLEEVFNLQSRCIQNYFNHALQDGYAGCMVWEYGIRARAPERPERRRDLSNPAYWNDIYPLLWTNSEGQLCERPVVQVIQNFSPIYPTPTFTRSYRNLLRRENRPRE